MRIILENYYYDYDADHDDHGDHDDDYDHNDDDDVDLLTTLGK